MITVSIIGGTGYTGSELLRILSNHPEVEIKYITSRKMDGVKITKLHPNLKGIKNLDNTTFKNIFPADIDSDFVFCATPHGASMHIVPELYEKGMKIIDLSGDYRFEDISTYEEWYNLKHTGKLDAVYGLPELHREDIKKTKLVANPGCFPTGAILALAPLVKEDLIEDRIIVDSKTGVSGAGVNPSETTHFPNVNENIKPYKLTTHRHSPEIEKELEKLTNKNIKLSFTPHLAPITRGILTTTHTFLKENVKRAEVIDIYKKFYKNEPFVRIFDEGAPTLTGVRGSNFCDIGGFEVDKYGRLVMVSAIDNLVKGASGQAIQNMNLMAGFNETEALLYGGLKP
ncbi:N-acetyl-gamma-glutamyl-phosphate reductase [Methanothermococcus okinawensis]|uniref:N-acetyl-gamma-glutamyl-phosphate reductase n=1 Tax=Methanothermococcus okinawensis (strain DSM 14208 / JCM 11175 / IH1) TaxID=647113 RepID=F8ALG7_METOI|nr:N-acetyl-gamma-glutamyl-phosphate reductase [Methanothermococcus okinawensis]AEH06561.1 N-acetyl-gamma-glutamyl-phosphate reductase [Methanothermococcus okinawensis IH1]